MYPIIGPMAIFHPGLLGCYVLHFFLKSTSCKLIQWWPLKSMNSLQNLRSWGSIQPLHVPVGRHSFSFCQAVWTLLPLLSHLLQNSCKASRHFLFLIYLKLKYRNIVSGKLNYPFFFAWFFFWSHKGRVAPKNSLFLLVLIIVASEWQCCNKKGKQKQTKKTKQGSALGDKVGRGCKNIHVFKHLGKPRKNTEITREE